MLLKRLMAVFFVSRNIVKGIVPSILEDLLDRRQQTRAKMKTADEDDKRVLDATQLALKILLNSFYAIRDTQGRGFTV